VAIPIKAAATAATNADLAINVKVDSDAGCNSGHIAIPFHVRMGVDEAAAVATGDGFETQLFAWTPTGAVPGVWSRATALDGSHALFGLDTPFVADNQVVSPVFSVGAQPFVVRFQHAFDFESDAFGEFFDGGVIELSTDGGLTWRDVTMFGANPQYPAVLTPQSGNPIAGQPAYSGRNAAFPQRDAVTLDFGTGLAGQLVQLRFRSTSDFCCSTGAGWTIDDISVSGINNTPFPGYVAEPTRCVAPTPAGVAPDEGVIAVRPMPRHTLAGVAGASDAQ
jgi:hypothetical protein